MLSCCVLLLFPRAVRALGSDRAVWWDTWPPLSRGPFRLGEVEQGARFSLCELEGKGERGRFPSWGKGLVMQRREKKSNKAASLPFWLGEGVGCQGSPEHSQRLWDFLFFPLFFFFLIFWGWGWGIGLYALLLNLSNNAASPSLKRLFPVGLTLPSPSSPSWEALS